MSRVLRRGVSIGNPSRCEGVASNGSSSGDMARSYCFSSVVPCFNTSMDNGSDDDGTFFFKSSSSSSLASFLLSVSISS